MADLLQETRLLRVWRASLPAKSLAALPQAGKIVYIASQQTLAFWCRVR